MGCDFIEEMKQSGGPVKFAIFAAAILCIQFPAFADQKKPDARKPASSVYYCEEYRDAVEGKTVQRTIENSLNAICNPSLPFSVTKMNQTEFSFCCIAK